MSKAIVTFATGGHTDLLALSRPRLMAYATRHGYAYIEATEVPATRPPSWFKVKALEQVLSLYDAVLWLDCDIVIVDGSRDIADEVERDAWQALVEHSTPEGTIPNCGVWYVTPPMQPYLAHLWEMTRYLDHRWWEQAALLDLLGYPPDILPVARRVPTPLYARTQFLDLAWNSHEGSDRAQAPRFVHCTPGPLALRAQRMRDYLRMAEAQYVAA